MQFDWQWVWSVAAGLFVLALWLVAVAGWQFLRASKYVQDVRGESEALDQLFLLADKYVTSAAQQFQGASGAQKRDWVLEQLSKRFPDIDQDLARAALEDAYNDVVSYGRWRKPGTELPQYKPEPQVLPEPEQSDGSSR